MAVLPTGIGPVTGYNIERSLRFNSADTAYLNRTPGSTGNRRTFTFSFWIKRTTLGTAQRIFQSQDDGTVVGNVFGIIWAAANNLYIYEYSSSARLELNTTQVFRDVSAWYHIVVAIDTTQATASNRAKVYVNGSQVTTFSTATYPSQNTDLFWNVSGQPCFIGRYFDGTTASSYLNAYLTEVNFINGQVPTTTTRTVNGVTETILTQLGEFSSSTGVWTPKAWDGTYGTNGFFLKFADNSGTTSTTLGKDSSGNGNNWTPNNFSVTAGVNNDSMVDSPTSYGTDTGVGGEVRGNYCTLNPLDKGTNATLANGNLFGSTSTTAWAMIRSTFAMSSGKWYWEFTVATTQIIIGLAKSNASLANYVGADANGWGWYGATGNKVNGGTQVTYVGVWAANDVIGVSFDADVGTLVFYKNGVSQGTAYTGLTSGPYFPAISFSSASDSANANFGQRAFANTAPSGFKALCTQNLPPVTIGATSTTQAGKYFNAVTYTGNATYPRTITGVGFQPDLVWIKTRSSAFNHSLTDAVRGATKVLYSDLTAVENTTGQFSNVSFASDGFVLGSTTSTDITNSSSATHVAWNWNAGGSDQTISVGQYSTSPNVPSIASTVRANTTSGFSIVTFTTNNTAGATVGHGCQVGGVATTPDMIIMKYRGLAANWVVYHKSMNATPQNGYLNLNTTAGYAALIDPWNNTAPSSTVITMGAGAGSAGSTNYGVFTSVAYCFAAVPGYSSFGSYTGNNSATDGTFVYLGFRPRFLMIKSTSGSTSWVMMDSARNTYNLADTSLYAESTNSEATIGTVNDIDFLSNGFKLRNNTGFVNASQTYVYAAFAEHPFKYSLAR